MHPQTHGELGMKKNFSAIVNILSGAKGVAHSCCKILNMHLNSHDSWPNHHHKVEGQYFSEIL